MYYAKNASSRAATRRIQEKAARAKFAVGSPELTVSGADLLITPTSPVLANGAQYAVLIDADAIKDLRGNFFAGFSSEALGGHEFLKGEMAKFKPVFRISHKKRICAQGVV